MLMPQMPQWKNQQTRYGSLGARYGLLLAALTIYFLASGCGSIVVNDDTPPALATPAVSELPNNAARHDLAILGVDFDPALDVQRLLNHEPVNLIVGVSNQGNRSETAVLVKANLWSADGSQHLLRTQQTVDSISAGNVVAVHLTPSSTPPFLSRYRLTVEILPVAGESNTQNNTRTLDILVNSAH